ncbi:MAG: Ig-like domain-containing protein [Chloroflexota bacterium]
MRLPERQSHARALPAQDDASLTLGRRIGVLVVLIALGGAVLLAANGGGEQGRGVVATPTAAVAAATAATPATPVTGPAGPNVAIVGAPTGRASFVAPDATLVNTRRVSLKVRVPDPGVPWDGMELRVLRGGTQVLARAVAPGDLSTKGRVTLKGIPLRRGTNRLTVVLANAAGTGPASDTLTLKLDDRPPRLKVTEPRDASTVNADTVTVRGRTVAGARVIVRNVTTDQKVEAYADGDGSFQAGLRLKRGRDTIKVAVADAAGNQSVRQLVIVRGNGRPDATLWLSRKAFRRSTLPKDLDIRATVRDAEGRPVKGAEVTFAVAPPGPPTQVREATTGRDGVAEWSGFRIVKDVVGGQGLVTIRVTLPDGREITSTKAFEVR